MWFFLFLYFRLVAFLYNRQVTRQDGTGSYSNILWRLILSLGSCPESYRNGSLIRTSMQTTDLQSPSIMHALLWTYFCFPSGAPGSPTVTVKIEATSITVRWTKPADDGGSPITAYRVLTLRGNTEIKNENITDTSVKHQDIGGLNKSTNYTIKLFARNYVFEGKATERKIQTKYEGIKICTKNA